HVRDWIDASGVHVGRVTVRRWTNHTWVAQARTVQPNHPLVGACWRDFRRFAATLAVYHDGDQARLLFFHEVGEAGSFAAEGWARRRDDPHIDRLQVWTAPLRPGPADASIDCVPASTLSQIATTLRHQFGPVVSQALSWDGVGLVAAQTKRPNGGIYEVRTTKGRGFVVVDRPDQPSNAEGEDIVWTLTDDGDASAVLRGAEVVAAHCGLTRATAMGVDSGAFSRASGWGTCELVAASAIGLRQFDTDRFSAPYDGSCDLVSRSKPGV
ncbi:MAG: hypothetical protein AAFV29_23620, partial [Myxococcota bacterium]